MKKENKLNTEIKLKHLIIGLISLFCLNFITTCSNEGAYMVREQRKITSDIDSIQSNINSIGIRLSIVEKNTSMKDSVDYVVSRNVSEIKDDMDDIKIIAAKKSRTSIILQDKRKDEE